LGSRLPDPRTFLETLARCLPPAGFRLAEEPNMLTWAAADGTEPGGDTMNRVISRSLEAPEKAGLWRNSLGPRLPRLLTSAGLNLMGCEGTCSVPDLGHSAVRASAAQSLRLAAANALAAGSSTEADLEASIRLIRDQEVSMVTPTLFGALARLPPVRTFSPPSPLIPARQHDHCH
jgi:hypothetical protein